jgi:uncharacterized damage-inducible protein DinB
MSDGRFALAPTADERSVLLTFLDWQRDTLVRKCAGLSDEQLRLRAVPTSNLTLVGLVRHLAGVERWYFQVIMAGEAPPELFTATDDADEDFNDIASATGAAAFAVWRAQVAHSRRVVAGRPLEAVGTNPVTGQRHALRWVLGHMIDEYARHNGHADLIREAVDGTAGE